MAEPTDVAALGRAAAERAWAAAERDGRQAPRYPELSVWLAFAADMRARGQVDRIDWNAHREFVQGYQAELDARGATADLPPPGAR